MALDCGLSGMSFTGSMIGTGIGLVLGHVVGTVLEPAYKKSPVWKISIGSGLVLGGLIGMTQFCKPLRLL